VSYDYLGEGAASARTAHSKGSSKERRFPPPTRLRTPRVPGRTGGLAVHQEFLEAATKAAA
jgi:hypothetical protein